MVHQVSSDDNGNSLLEGSVGSGLKTVRVSSDVGDELGGGVDGSLGLLDGLVLILLLPKEEEEGHEAESSEKSEVGLVLEQSPADMLDESSSESFDFVMLRVVVIVPEIPPSVVLRVGLTSVQ